jgi:hypothetical protein
MPRSPRRRIRLVTVIGGLRFCRARLGSQHLRQFSTSNGYQDHTVLPYALASLVWRDDNRSRQAALQSIFTHDDAASTASRPNVRDDGQRPFFSGQDGAAYSFDLPDAPSEIFLQGSLDRANHVDPTEEIVALEQSRRSRFDGHLALTAQARELVVRVVG